MAAPPEPSLPRSPGGGGGIWVAVPSVSSESSIPRSERKCWAPRRIARGGRWTPPSVLNLAATAGRPERLAAAKYATSTLSTPCAPSRCEACSVRCESCASTRNVTASLRGRRSPSTTSNAGRASKVVASNPAGARASAMAVSDARCAQRSTTTLRSIRRPAAGRSSAYPAAISPGASSSSSSKKREPAPRAATRAPPVATRRSVALCCAPV
eukprot:5759014-Prymnesium_polylepis.1